jgi:hypothetical protein
MGVSHAEAAQQVAQATVGSGPTTLEIIGTVLFAIAVIHTFVATKFEALAHKYPEGSIKENLFHFLGEVEAIFGLWAGLFIAIFAAFEGFTIYDDHHHLIGGAIHYLETKINFTEPAFVFVIMCMAGTRPVILFAEKIIMGVAKALPIPEKMAFYISALIIGPLLGSFITEPAAMTVTALILLDYFFSGKMSPKFKYATLGLLFVNISIGGTLTHFAAPQFLWWLVNGAGVFLIWPPTLATRRPFPFLFVQQPRLSYLRMNSLVNSLSNKSMTTIWSPLGGSP